MENVIEPDARRTLERAHVHFLVHSHAMLLRLRFSFVHTLLDAGLRSSTVHGIQQHSTLLVPQDPEVDPIIPVPSAFGLRERLGLALHKRPDDRFQHAIDALPKSTADSANALAAAQNRRVRIHRLLGPRPERLTEWDLHFHFDKVHRHSSKM